MADVRSLLRQQNQARRIEHPYAAYSDAGKLLCTLCRDQIRAESQWESHLQSSSHRQRLEGLEAARKDAAAARKNGSSEDAVAQNQKRKVDDEDTVAMEVDDAMRRKRSRADISVPNDQAAEPEAVVAAEQANGRRDANRTPPTLVRRMSSTPSRGVEIQIPSRPATPATLRESSTSTPGGGSSLPSGAAAGTPTATALSAQAHSKASDATKSAEAAPAVDEAEWAAFEADMAAEAAPYSEDAVISAPAMNAEEAAAAAASATDGDGGDFTKRKLKGEVDIADDKEEASRAMEDEFDEMQELEARVRRLKEKREELRKRTESNTQEAGAARPQVAVEEVQAEAVASDEDEDDDDEDDDDWDGFRFRAA